MFQEFAVKRTGKTSDATIRRGGEEVATLRSSGESRFALESARGGAWDLNPRVQGEIRPFSMNVTSSEDSGKPVLTIRNHVFFHGGRAYMLTGVPEDVKPADHLLGKRHINRLGQFPFSSLEEIDPETWGRLRMHRGVAVGTIEGLGIEEFRVALSEELQDVGLPLAAASYLLYSTG
jgi:hypothetical protein